MLSSDIARRLAEERATAALALVEVGSFSSAYYLAGYAVELGLKAIIAKQFVADVIPDKQFVLSIYSHKLADLLKLAGLQTALTQAANEKPTLQENWLTASQWSESSRYAISDEVVAREFVAAVTDPAEGVLQWLKSHC
ncbi:hypothetical protein [Brevundimonas sp. R86498]|uniref:hypothetical protein n=1 Tax=Brevundimonas sp. R86498 TaxID=3093845 RepID=UPI0037CBDE1E